MWPTTSTTPSEPPRSRQSFEGAPNPDRLEAARRRLRTTATQLPEPSGPPDASRLPKALRRLGRRDPAAGGRVVAALLPAHDLPYQLVLTDVGRIGNGPIRIETDAAGLGRLVLGSPPRRLLARRAVRIDGRRRSAAVRPLRRAARKPVPWERLAAAGVTLDANLAYRWIALAVDPKWTRGERFTIAHVRQEDPDRPWFVRADDGRPLTVTAAEPRDRPAAEVHCPDAGLAAFLAQAADHPARVTGDAAAVALLLAWANGRRA